MVNDKRKACKSMNKKVEILAPAGSYDSMRAAMNAGCDAVYIGGSNFGARAYADNPDEGMLLKAIDEAHIRGKKLYLTVNTLLKEKELAGQLYNFLEKFYLRGLDAVIVQDVGVLRFIHRHFPDLPIHASTQMTLTMAQGANLLKEFGVTRLVTSRELSLQEIKNIRENTDMEIETFVHGALCYCFSGQCLMSSLIGGRSGNRGRCAQPCRMPYRLFVNGKCMSGKQELYMLSPKDINTLAIIPELVEAGIDSFKIEGRMKGPEYAAITSYMYRKYLDLYYTLGASEYKKIISGEEFRQDMLKLQDVYNRGGFSQGYAKTYHGKSMMSMSRPNHSGVYVGKVKAIKDGSAEISLSEKLNAQDVLEIRKDSGKLYEFTVKQAHMSGEIFNIKLPKYQEMPSSRKKTDAGRINAGDEVYRTRNNALLDFLTEEYVKKDAQYPIKGRLTARTKESLTLTLTYGAISVTASHNIVEEAKSQPVSKERIKSQLEKTGASFFYFDELLIEADDNIFIPLAWLNELRRSAITRLEEAIVSAFRREHKKLEADKQAVSPDAVDFDANETDKETDANKAVEESIRDKKADSFGAVVSVQNIKQWKTALLYPEITAVYANFESFKISEIISMAEETSLMGKSVYLILPHICRQTVYKSLERDLDKLADIDSIKGFIAKNFEEIALLKSLYKGKDRKKETILNYNMYVYNEEAKSFWKELGINHFTAAVELNYKELKELGVSDSDMPVYGYLPLMISAQCVFDNAAACLKAQAAGSKTQKDEMEAKDGLLTDRLGKKFFVRAFCKGCYNVIYNGQPLALHKQADEIIALKPENIRLDFTIETEEQMKKILDIFIGSYFSGGFDGAIDDYTTGHYKRGVL